MGPQRVRHDWATFTFTAEPRSLPHSCWKLGPKFYVTLGLGIPTEECKAGQKNLKKCYHKTPAPFLPMCGLCPGGCGLCSGESWGMQTQPRLAHPLASSWPASLRNVPHLWLLTPRIRNQKMMPMGSFIRLQRDKQTQPRMPGLGEGALMLI